MFARLLRRVKLIHCERSGDTNIWKGNSSRFSSYEPAPNTTEAEKPPRQLKQWRPEWDSGSHKLHTKLKIFDRGGRPSMDFIVMMNAPWDLSRENIKRWWVKKKRDMEIFDQRFVKKRHEILGSNLATAHFLVHRGGKVKFIGQPEWVEKDKDDEYKLPEKFAPNYVIEAIDANGINLYYEGLENLCHLYELKSVSLRGCKTIDDWCLDRLSNLCYTLEHLDLSNCPEVSERGLEALYRMQSLKTLIVTNYNNSPAFELTCLMLEDCTPGLRCEIRSPEPKNENEKPKDNDKMISKD